MSDDQPQEPPHFQIAVPPANMAGVWANYAQVSESPFEFTLDFCRLDFASNTGVLVARVSMSPLLVMQLVELLQGAWQQYTDRAMPPEVTGDGEQGEAGDDRGA